MVQFDSFMGSLVLTNNLVTIIFKIHIRLLLKELGYGIQDQPFDLTQIVENQKEQKLET